MIRIGVNGGSLDPDLRYALDYHGNFALIGHTLAQDCRAAPPYPTPYTLFCRTRVRSLARTWIQEPVRAGRTLSRGSSRTASAEA